MIIIVGITGASGVIYGYRLLEILKNAGHEVHAIVSSPAWEVLKYECNVEPEQVKNRVDFLYEISNFSAGIASGSYKTDAMVIVPCTMKTLGTIANGIADNLMGRAADVMLKEGRPLILVPRETPLNSIHIANMLKLSQAGVKIAPACPGFYHLPATVDEIVDMMVGKICDLLKIETNLFRRWAGTCQFKQEV